MSRSRDRVRRARCAASAGFPRSPAPAAIPGCSSSGTDLPTAGGTDSPTFVPGGWPAAAGAASFGGVAGAVTAPVKSGSEGFAPDRASLSASRGRNGRLGRRRRRVPDGGTPLTGGCGSTGSGMVLVISGLSTSWPATNCANRSGASSTSPSVLRANSAMVAIRTIGTSRMSRKMSGPGGRSCGEHAQTHARAFGEGSARRRQPPWDRARQGCVDQGRVNQGCVDQGCADPAISLRLGLELGDSLLFLSEVRFDRPRRCRERRLIRRSPALIC